MKLNKLLAGLGAAVLTAALAVTASAADPLVVWDFSQADNAALYNADGTVVFSVNNGTATYDADNACLNLDVEGGDPFFVLPNQGTFPAENSFVRVKYNLTDISDWSTSIYFTTDTVQWSETGHWKGFYDGDDGEWCEQTFYMTECAAWAGTITDMRLDIFDAAYAGQNAKVAYVAVFGNEEDANAFDFAAWQNNGRPVTLSAAAPAADGPALPSTEYDSIANYAGIKPVIDGKIDAIWDATAAQESTWPGDLNGEGISGYTKILWDEDNLYFLGVVNDPTTLQEANPTTTDSIDFWISETYSDEMGYPLEGDYQLALSPYNTYGGNKAPDFVNETGAVINGDGTYIVEFSIPWQTADLKPAEGHVFGYNASFNNDLEGDGKRDSWTSWVEWNNMPYWSDTMWLGKVELVKADIPVAVEEAPAAEEAAAPAAEEANIFASASVVEVSGLEVEGSNTGDMAIDGDMATRWSSNTDDAAHIIVDLGAVTPVDSLDIYWETACAADYTVEVSEDNANWTVVATVTDNAVGASPAGDAVSHSWDTVNARYIKINCTRRNTEWGNSIWEMVAYAAEAPVVEAPAEEAPVEEAPVEEAPVEEAPAEEVVAEEPVVVEEEVVEEAPVEEAAETFDFAVIAAIAAAVSAAGYAISKKR